MTTPIPSPADLAARVQPALDLLIWDAPNIDMTLANVIGRRPNAATRPRYDHVAKWFLDGAGDRHAQAAVFTNYTEGTAVTIRPWLEAVRSIGFDVFVKPKVEADDDIDLDMLAHIESTRQTPFRLHRLVVVSGDRRNFQEPLEQLVAAGVQVVVVSFNEVASWAAQSSALSFIDIENIPGAFRTPLSRIRLEDLPREGAWLPPTGRLDANRDVEEPGIEDALPAAS